MGVKCACRPDRARIGDGSIFGDDTPADEADCNLPCPGDASNTCGGPQNYQLYELFDGIPVDETPGPGPAELEGIPPEDDLTPLVSTRETLPLLGLPSLDEIMPS